MNPQDEKTRILFVDDDANLLRGQRRMLRAVRDEWDMHFVESGRQALEFLSSHEIDVIVTDMRMPGMDGAELLAEVSRRCPGVVRIVLSGYAESEAVTRTIGISHQYLDKPCDPDRLIAAVRRSLDIRKILRVERLRDFAAGLAKLPSPTDTYRDFLNEMENPRATTASIAGKIETDISLAAKILKLTNSAYFTLPHHISDIRQAVQLLGLDTIRSLVAISSFFAEFEADPALATLIERLGRRSVGIGGLARAIMQAEGMSRDDQCSACSAGLLSHIGTLLLIGNCPDGYRSACHLSDHDGMAFIDAERQVFGATHAELGAYLLGLWGFSDPIIEAVAFHHAPSAIGGKEFGIVSAVHLAQALSKNLAITTETDGDAVPPHVDVDHLAAVGKLDRLPAWQDLLNKTIVERSAA